MMPFLILGPGTLSIIGLGARPLVLLLSFTWTVALIGGAILASTDPVVLREILWDERIPHRCARCCGSRRAPTISSCCRRS